MYFKKRFRPRFLNEWLNKVDYTDSSFLFAMYDIIHCPEFQSYMNKMLEKDFSRFNYNKLFDDLVKHIMNEEKTERDKKGERSNNKMRHMLWINMKQRWMNMIEETSLLLMLIKKLYKNMKMMTIIQ